MTPIARDSHRTHRPSALLLSLMLAAAPVAGFAQTADPAPAEAPVAAEVGALMAALRLGDILAVLREEGVDSGRSIEEDMFPGRGGAAWAAKVEDIYDPGRMEAAFGAAFAGAIGTDAVSVAAAVDFFGSDLGQRIIGLEIEGRRALMEEAAEDAAKLEWSRLEAEDDPRAALLQRFAAVNDLVEANVQGALNSNLAFLRGMAEAGGMMAGMAEEDMLASVWSQEEELRQETVDWLYPYLTLAYEPLPDADLEAYIAFSDTPAGQAVNAALFAAYGAVFEEISGALGRAAGIQLQGQDI